MTWRFPMYWVPKKSKVVVKRNDIRVLNKFLDCRNRNQLYLISRKECFGNYNRLGGQAWEWTWIKRNMRSLEARSMDLFSNRNHPSEVQYNELQPTVSFILALLDQDFISWSRVMLSTKYKLHAPFPVLLARETGSSFSVTQCRRQSPRLIYPSPPRNITVGQESLP